MKKLTRKMELKWIKTFGVIVIKLKTLYGLTCRISLRNVNRYLESWCFDAASKMWYCYLVNYGVRHFWSGKSPGEKKWELLGRLFCDDQNISDRTEPISRVLKKFHLINFFSWYLLNNKLQHNGVFRLQNFGCWKKVAASPNHLKSRTTCVLLWCFEISWWNFPLCLDKPHWTPS